MYLESIAIIGKPHMDEQYIYIMYKYIDTSHTARYTS